MGGGVTISETGGNRRHGGSSAAQIGGVTEEEAGQGDPEVRGGPVTEWEW